MWNVGFDYFDLGESVATDLQEATLKMLNEIYIIDIYLYL